MQYNFASASFVITPDHSLTSADSVSSCDSSCSTLQNRVPPHFPHVTDSSASDTRGQIDRAGMEEAQLFILNKQLFCFFSFLNNETSHISLCLPLPYLLSLKCYDISMCIFHAGSLCCYCIQSVQSNRGRASIMVFFSFFKIQYKKVEKKNKHDVSGSISVEKPKPVAFLCCKLNFYFHIHLWFLQALKQDNKRICSNVQLVSHFNFSQSNVASGIELHRQYQP